MKSFIYNNQMTVFVIGFVLFLIVLYFIIKALPAKVSKKDKKKQEEKKEVNEPQADNEVEKKQTDVIQESEQKPSKKEDKKPKIIQVFKRERKTESSSDQKSTYDPIYDRNVEFINTSKNISKFKSFADDVVDEDQETDEFGFVQDAQEDCGLCEAKVKHFDHTRRLSEAFKNNNYDDVFASHISEKYLNIDENRHLKLDEEFSSKLFERTEKMMKNSDKKVGNNEDVETQMPQYSLFSQPNLNETEDELLEDDVKINMKTALIAETYFGKRRKKK